VLLGCKADSKSSLARRRGIVSQALSHEITPRHQIAESIAGSIIPGTSDGRHRRV